MSKNYKVEKDLGKIIDGVFTKERNRLNYTKETFLTNLYSIYLSYLLTEKEKVEKSKESLMRKEEKIKKIEDFLIDNMMANITIPYDKRMIN